MLLNYRKDIDGLRAIAVLLVVLFHLGLPISGGFIGVDIFFVISGFLIASLIQKQILANKFSFKGFYLHRMRRILPALLFVILGTFILAWFTLLFRDFTFFTNSIVYALAGFSNIHFYSKGQDYFAISSDQVTLLHTWSLGVEEQFYFLAPIFLILLFKYFYNTKFFNLILLAFIFIGLVVSHFYALNNASAAYYLLPSRFFELLMGVFLALNFAKIPVSNNKIINNILAVIALLLIFAPAFMLTKQDIFPSYNAFIVCLGTCLVIYLGKLQNPTFLTKIISLKPFVFIGLISYSLYLWHWPIISILDVINIDLTIAYKILLLVLFIILASITWKFIEQPFRHKYKMSFKWTFILLLITPIIVFQTVKIVAKKTNAFSVFRFEDNIPNIVKNLPVKASKQAKYCHVDYINDFYIEDKCVIGDLTAQVDTLIFGDSHANDKAPFIEQALKNAGLKSKILTMSSTMYLKGYNPNLLGLNGESITQEDALEYMQIINKEIESGKYKNIIFTGYFATGLRKYGKNKLQQMFFDTIEQIHNKNANVYILEDAPFIGGYSEYCDIYNKLLNLNKQCHISTNNEHIMPKAIEDIFNNIKIKYPNVKIIDLKDTWCKDDKCNLLLNDTLLYEDSNHLSYLGAKLLGKMYLEKMPNPFK